MNEVFTVKEVAEYLHCSQSTIRKLLKNNQIPSFRVTYKVFFKKVLSIYGLIISALEIVR